MRKNIIVHVIIIILGMLGGARIFQAKRKTQYVRTTDAAGQSAERVFNIFYFFLFNFRLMFVGAANTVICRSAESIHCEWTSSRGFCVFEKCNICVSFSSTNICFNAFEPFSHCSSSPLASLDWMACGRLLCYLARA